MVIHSARKEPWPAPAQRMQGSQRFDIKLVIVVRLPTGNLICHTVSYLGRVLRQPVDAKQRWHQVIQTDQPYPMLTLDVANAARIDKPFLNERQQSPDRIDCSTCSAAVLQVNSNLYQPLLRLLIVLNGWWCNSFRPWGPH